MLANPHSRAWDINGLKGIRASGKKRAVRTPYNPHAPLPMLPLRNEGKHKNEFHLLSPVVLNSRKIIYRTMAEKKTLKVSRLWELLWVAMIP